jgi:hypothetical protein
VLNSFLSKLQDDHMLTKVEIGVDEGYGQGAWISKTLK